MMVNLFILL
jgi:hypothetical protein